MAELNIEKKSRSSVLPIMLVIAAIALLVWMFNRNDDASRQPDRTVGARPQAVSLAAPQEVRALPSGARETPTGSAADHA